MKITLLTGRTFDYAAELGFDIRVIKSPRARKLILRVDNKDRIPVLTVPRYCSSKKAIEFVRRNQEWLDKCLEKLPKARRFAHGDQISFFGKTLTVIHTPEARSGVVAICDEIHISGQPEFLHRRLIDFIKQKAKDKFFTLSQKKAEKIGCKINSISIKDTKSRWGSCSNRGNINYNWRIALAPDFVIAYLVAHEVAHLRHPDHSDAFWTCVRQLCPQYVKGRNWLKEHGKDLYLYE